MDKKTLELLANKLLFTMNDSEYEVLSKEFDIILKQMEAINNIEGIEKVEPLIYPFKLDNVSLREDEIKDELPIEDILSNSGDTLYNQVRVPKVVE